MGSTWYAQNGGADFLTLVLWNSAADGSGGSQGPGGFSLVSGDVYDLNGQAGITVSTFSGDITIQDVLGTSGGLSDNGGGMNFGPAEGTLVLNVLLANIGGGNITAGTGTTLLLGPGGSITTSSFLTAVGLIDASGSSSSGPLGGGGTFAAGGAVALLLSNGMSAPSLGSRFPIVYLPTSAQVQSTVQFGASGTYTGNRTDAPTGSVLSGTSYGASGTSLTGTLSVPTAAQIATAVWQDATSGDFTVSGSAGLALVSAGSAPTAGENAAAVWQDLLSSSDFSIAGSAGALVLGNLNAVMSTLATSTALSALQTHGDTAWATATGFATSGALASVATLITGLQTHGDTAWATATGFATSGALASVATLITGLQTHGDTAWATATGFATSGALASVATSITGLQTHGDTAWATATGFATPTDIGNLQTHGDTNWTPPATSAIAAAVGARTITAPAPGAPPASPTADYATYMLYAAKVFDAHADGNGLTRDIRDATGTVLCSATIAFTSGVYSQGAMA